MKRVFNLRTPAYTAISCALICAAAMLPLRAQNGEGRLAGTVLDQVGKPIQGAAVTVKGQSGPVGGMTVSDPDGRFVVSGLATGTYTVEVTSPGFARNTRLGVPVSAGGSQEITITMNVDAVSQSITVQETVTLAADTAPLGNTLD